MTNLSPSSVTYSDIPTQTNASGTSGPLSSLIGSSPLMTYYYPIDIESLSHAMVFNVVAYNIGTQQGVYGTNSVSPTSASQQNSQNGQIAFGNQITAARTQVKKTNMALVLYVPETVIYDQSQQYESPSLIDLGGSVGSSVLHTVTGGKARGGAIGRLIRAAGTLVQPALAAERALVGYVINPQLEVLYSSPMLREFLFEFVLAPRNQQEATNILNIIQTFRREQAPNLQSKISNPVGDVLGPKSFNLQGAYFIPPSQFDISFLTNISGSFVPNPTLPKISTCVLENINVNYTPQNAFITMKDAMPSMIRLLLRFREIDVITKNLIDGYGY